MWAIKNNGRYVALPGRKSSFTTKVENAQKFDTKEAAQANACGNETVVPLRMVWGE